MSPILIFVGSLLLAFGVLAWLWIGPAVRKAPIDTQSRTVATGGGTYYDFEQGQEVESDSLESVTNTQSDQSVYEGEDAIDRDIAVYDQTSGLFDRDAGYEITFSESRIAIDRATALPVDCCNSVPDDGLTVKWPFDVEQREYPLWDGTLGEAVTANFAGEEEVDGLPVYRFEVAIPTTDAGPATDDGEFPRIEYEATKVYLVEPMTGRIISSQQDVRQSLIGEDGDVLFDAVDVSLSVSDETIADNVDVANADTAQLRLLDLSTWLGPLLGLIAILAGLFIWSRTETPAASRREPVPANR
ncbi:MAG: DUF3068 domain-containing protein [Nitriliruptorales bacterium]|nr:DUF3068 domain-containing protein [Nitriliruptorales bacterium]